MNSNRLYKKWLTQTNTIEHIEQLSDFLQVLPFPAGIKDIDSRFITVNTACAELVGHNKISQMEGTTDFDLKCKAADHAEHFISQDKEVLSSSHKTTLDVCFYSDGSLHTFLNNKIKVFLKEKNKHGVLFMMNSIDNVVVNKLIQLSNDGYQNKALQKIAGTYTVTKNKPFKKTRLSNREQEILFFLLRSNSAKLIANKLQLSQRTVESHIEKLKIKFCTHSKIELIEKAINEGHFYQLPESVLS